MTMGSDVGAYFLGEAFFKGTSGLPKDPARARYWLKKLVDGECEAKQLNHGVPPGSGQAPWLILAGGRRETSHSVRGLLGRPKGSFRHTITHLQLH